MIDLSENTLIAKTLEEVLQADLSDHGIAATLNLLAFTINRFIGNKTGLLLPVLREIKYCRSPKKFRFVVDGGNANRFLVQCLFSKFSYKAIQGERDGFSLILEQETWISSRVEGSE